MLLYSMDGPTAADDNAHTIDHLFRGLNSGMRLVLFTFQLNCSEEGTVELIRFSILNSIAMVFHFRQLPTSLLANHNQWLANLWLAKSRKLSKLKTPWQWNLHATCMI